MSQLTRQRQQFVEQVCDHVKVKFPLVKIAIGEQPFTLRVNGNLATLENVYRMAKLRPEERLHHIDRWIVELLRERGNPRPI